MVRLVEPDLPNCIQDRAADCWEPLLVVADEAGGDWPSRARAAAVHLTQRRTPATRGLAARSSSTSGGGHEVRSSADPAAAPAPAPTAAPTGPATKAPVTPPAAPPATTFCVWVQPTKSSAVRAAASPSSFIPIPSSRGECPSARLSESKRGDHRRKLARERQRRKRERERDGEACVQVWLPDITDAWCLLSDAGMMPDPIPEDDRDSSYYGVRVAEGWPGSGRGCLPRCSRHPAFWRLRGESQRNSAGALHGA